MQGKGKEISFKHFWKIKKYIFNFKLGTVKPKHPWNIRREVKCNKNFAKEIIFKYLSVLVRSTSFTEFSGNSVSFTLKISTNLNLSVYSQIKSTQLCSAKL